jgi:hypothetical protein
VLHLLGDGGQRGELVAGTGRGERRRTARLERGPGRYPAQCADSAPRLDPGK